MRWRLTCLVLLLVSATACGDWVFSDAVTVSDTHGESVFHHLESSGRRNIAVSGDVVGIAWEHNGNGTPGIYLAVLPDGAGEFTAPLRISGGDEAYEPSVSGVGDGRFLVAWEEGGAGWLSLVDGKTIGKPVKIAGDARELSVIANQAGQAAVVWSDQSARHAVIRFASVGMEGGELQVSKPRRVDSSPPEAGQHYPDIAIVGNGYVVVWHDLRRGTSAIFSATTADGQSFTPVAQVNQTIVKSHAYGKGSGAARAVVAAFGADAVATVWLDKRAHLSGYEVYGSLSKDGGKSWGLDQRVQDSLGDLIPQWNAAVAGAPDGKLVAVWDDKRDDTVDVWIADRSWAHWGADYFVDPAAGDGDESSPTIAFDGQRRLHIAWVGRDEDSAVTRIYYAVGVEE